MRVLFLTIAAAAFAAAVPANSQPIRPQQPANANCQLVKEMSGGIVREWSCPSTKVFWSDLAWHLTHGSGRVRIDTVWHDPNSGHWFVVYGEREGN